MAEHFLLPEKFIKQVKITTFRMRTMLSLESKYLDLIQKGECK